MHYQKTIIFTLFLFQWLSFFGQEVSLVQPEGEFISQDTIVLLEWNTNDNAVSWHLQIATDSHFLNIIHDNFSLTNTNENVDLDYDHYYWKVRYNDGANYSDWSDSSSFYVFDCTKLSSIIMNLNTDSVHLTNDSLVSVCYDQSGLEKNAYQTSEVQRPIYRDSVIFNQPALYFDGSNDKLGIDSSANVGSLFILANWEGPALFPSYNGLFNAQTSSSPGIIFSAAINTSEFLLAYSPYFADDLNINGVQTVDFSPMNQFKIISGVNSDLSLYQNFFIGADRHYTNRMWNGYVTDVLMYSEALNDSLRFLVEQSIRYKYSPPVDLGRSIRVSYGFCDTVIDAGNRFTNYLWDTGETTQSIAVNKKGSYSVTVTDIFGYQSADSILVSYPETKYLNLNNDSTICLGDTIKWDTGLGANYIYEWTPIYGDSSICSIFSLGDYSVKIIDSNACFMFSDTLSIKVDSFPVQNSLGPDRNVCEGESVSLIELSDNIQSYLWNTTSTEYYINVLTPGEFTLEVSNARGCIGRDTINFGISGLSPTVLFDADTVCFGDSTTFSNLSSILGSDVIASYHWDFANSNTSDLENPKQLFQQVDTFSVTLTAITTSGCSSFFTDSVIIKYRPQALFDIQYGNVQCVNTEINLQELSSSDISISQYNWLFGDGNSSQEQNPSHIYILENDYNIKLQITANNECTDSIIKQISIQDELELPEQPSNLFPINHTYINSLQTPQFEWEESINAVNYIFEIASDPLFSDNYFLANTEDLFLNFLVPDTGIWYWRVTAYNLCGDYEESLTYQLTSINPSLSEELQVWFCADSVELVQDTLVNGWLDLSGNIRNAYQSSIDNSPESTISELNGHNALRFDGTNDYMLMDSALQIGSMFMICNWEGEGNEFPTYSGLITEQLGSTSSILFLSQNNGTSLGNGFFEDSIEINRIDTLNFAPLKKYKILYGNKIQARDFDNLIIGTDRDYLTGRNWNGDILEILIYDTILSAVKQNNINEYLRHKYAPPVNLGHDIYIPYGFCDTSITTGYKPWFESYLWNTGETDSVIVSQSGLYSVTVTDIFGFESTDEIRVSYPGHFIAGDTSICYGDTIKWNTRLHHAYDFLWKDNSTDSVLTITTTGEYFVEITDSNGCVFSSDTLRVTVDSYPITVSLGPDMTLCSGQSIYLETGADETVNYLWNNTETEDHIEIITAGEYSVTTTNAMGCVARDTIDIQIQGFAPAPGFYTENLCFGDITQFNDTSIAVGASTIVDWEWDFGDLSTSNIEHPTHSFSDTGLYTITLKIITDNSCENILTKHLRIYPNPVSSFYTNQLCMGNVVNLINTSTSDLGSIVYNRWDFGNNDTSLEVSIQHIFNAEGDVQVQLKTQTIYNCIHVLDSTLVIKPSPVADFVNSALCKGDISNFYDQTSASGIMLISSRLWEISTGESSTEAEPNFVFPNAGDINVSLISTSVNGCSDTISKLLHVYEKPDAVFNILDLCQNNATTITSHSTDSDGSILNYYWWLNSSLVSQDDEVNFLPVDTGDNLLKLKVISSTGCSDTLVSAFRVSPLPVGSFTVSETYTTPDKQVSFTADSINMNHIYHYDFANGFYAANAISTSSYSSPGDYYSKLIVENDLACKDSTEIRIRVVKPLLNMAITELGTFREDGKTKLSVLITNIGNLDIHGLTFRIEMNNNSVFEETKNNFDLKIGESILNTLSSQFIFDADQSYFLCVSAVANNKYEDIDIENNMDCLSYKQEDQILNTYPNPFNDEFVIIFRSENEESVDYQISDVLGKIVQSGSFEAAEGVSKYHISASQLSSGVYSLIINNSIKKLVKE